VSNLEEEDETTSGSIPDASTGANPHLPTFLRALGESILYGVVALLLAAAFGFIFRGDVIGIVLSGGIAMLSPVAVWIMAIREKFESPEEPGKAAGAAAGAAMFTGLWFLLMKTICGRM
jgi:vacuolar-type H+-ATPase subunit I/STV1